MKEKEALRYILMGIIAISLFSILLFLRGGFTGYAIFENSGTEFNQGTHTNTTYNGSDIILSPNNLTGTYTSQVFDATADASWNNLTWQGNTKTKENNSLSSALHLGSNKTEVFILDETYYLTDMKDSSKNFYLNFSENLINHTNLKIYAKKNKGVTIGIYSQSDTSGTNPIGTFTVTSITGEWYSITLNIETPTKAIWVGEGTGSETDPKDEFDYIYTEIPESNLTFQIRNCSQSDCSDGTWQTTDLTNINLQSRYFQYKVIFTTPDSSTTPSLNLVNLDYTILNTAPSLTLTSPQNTTYNFGQSISLNFSVSDSDNNLDSCWYNLNSGNNISLTNCQNTTLNLNNDGNYLLNIYANDTRGLESTDSVTYTILNTPPTVSIISPQNGTTYGYNESLNLNFTSSDSEGNIDSCWYNLNNQNTTITNCQNTTFNVSEGEHTLTVFINDTLGKEASDSVTFNIQVGSPTITIHSPINTYLNYNSIQFNYTPTDIDLFSCELWGDFIGTFQSNQTDNSPISGQVNNFQLTLPEGTYLWNIKCNDSLGNSAFNGNKTFHIDTTNPALNLNEPTGIKNSRSMTASWSVSDNSPITCLYNVYRGDSTEITNTSVNCSANTTNFAVTVDADFTFNFYTNDSAGNTNSTNSSFSVSTTTPPTPPPGGGGGGGGGSILPKNQTGKLEASIIREIIAQQGDKKTLLINVKNIGRTFLNNCKLSAKGEIISWIYSTQIQGIAPGENIDFIFDLNIPEGINPKDYTGELEVKCEEGINKQELTIKIPAGLQSIEIKEIQHTKEGLDINYNFKNTELPEENINIEIWIINSDKIEIKRITDSFQPTNEITQRKITMELPKDTIGIHDVYFALSSNKENYVKQSIVLGESRTTGQAILGETGSKIAGYIVFFLILGTLIFFGLRGHFKNKKKTKTSLLKKDKKTKSKKPITKNAKK